MWKTRHEISVEKKQIVFFSLLRPGITDKHDQTDKIYVVQPFSERIRLGASNVVMDQTEDCASRLDRSGRNHGPRISFFFLGEA